MAVDKAPAIDPARLKSEAKNKHQHSQGGEEKRDRPEQPHFTKPGQPLESSPPGSPKANGSCIPASEQLIAAETTQRFEATHPIAGGSGGYRVAFAILASRDPFPTTQQLPLAELFGTETGDTAESHVDARSIATIHDLTARISPMPRLPASRWSSRSSVQDDHDQFGQRVPEIRPGGRNGSGQAAAVAFAGGFHTVWNFLRAALPDSCSRAARMPVGESGFPIGGISGTG